MVTRPAQPALGRQGFSKSTQTLVGSQRIQEYSITQRQLDAKLSELNQETARERCTRNPYPVVALLSTVNDFAHRLRGALFRCWHSD